MHERAIAAAKKGLDAYMEREKVYANLADIARMLEIASKLGRLATGLGTEGEGRKADELPTVRVEVTVALEKIYGEPLPGEVAAPPAIVDVECTSPQPSPDALTRPAATLSRPTGEGKEAPRALPEKT